MRVPQKVFVAGPASAVRHAIVRRLTASGLPAEQIDTWDTTCLDSQDPLAVRAYLRIQAPDQIYIAAGPWGRQADCVDHRGSYLADALLGQAQLIHEAMFAGIRNLLFIASHQVYGRCPVLPIAEEDLAHACACSYREPVAIGHLAAIRLCEAYMHQYGEALDLTYRSVVVGNVYGPGDTLENSRTGELLALVRQIDQAKGANLSSLKIRSSGLRREDWLHADDMAAACIGLLGLPASKHQFLTDANRPHINLGSGEPSTTMQLAQAVARVVGYRGELLPDSCNVDEGPDFFLDTRRMRSTGWKPQVTLDAGIAEMYQDYLRQVQETEATS
ncbi:MAG: hypothetical protein CVU22_04880 [Betaproteobacteria bacterium HGW-Betaproteobacteria-16]|nr:MAG: hypothetical protein CVU22_04880 [Betaproteobacteria bacterium HGW-Betaproteobacteria-16]